MVGKILIFELIQVVLWPVFVFCKYYLVNIFALLSQNYRRFTILAVQTFFYIYFQPEEDWISSDGCQNCECLYDVNSVSGFHNYQCIDKYDCDLVDEETCNNEGGRVVPTHDGCCSKCDKICVDSFNRTHQVCLINCNTYL